MSLLMLPLLFSFTSGERSVNQRTITVDTSLGQIVGLNNSADGYLAFLGIPFGKSTSGESRFTISVAAGPWEGQLNATRKRPGCVGGNRGGDPVGKVDAGFSEDCLHLNIWTPPGLLSSEPLPVIVYIHGGGFMYGTADDPLYDMRHYASRGVIGVGIEYRLGAFGFLGAPGIPPNLGIRDQQLALTWVKNNIRDYGGDPGKVTIHGQSAGAMSILVHLVSPSSAGLFHGAIARSPVGLHHRTPQEAQVHGRTIAEAVACKLDDLHCLRSRPVDRILNAEIIPEYVLHFTDKGFGINFLPWVPTVDGDVLPAQPLDLIKAGNYSRVPVVLGTMANETDAWVPAISNSLVEFALFTGAIAVQFDNRTIRSDVLRLYESTSPTWHKRTQKWTTDLLFTCYAQEIAMSITQTSSKPAYLYQFMHPPSTHADPTNSAKHPLCGSGSACHAGDNMFAFGTESLLKPPAGFDGNFEALLSATMIDTYTNFSKRILDLNPGIEVGPLVPYDVQRQQSCQWGGNSGDELVGYVEGYREKFCRFWRGEGGAPHVL